MHRLVIATADIRRPQASAADADGAAWFSQTFSIGGSAPSASDFGAASLGVHFQTTSLVDGLAGSAQWGRRRSTAGGSASGGRARAGREG
jgi:hypothetical protein